MSYVSTQNTWGAGERDVLIPSVKMPFGDATYFCEHGRYFSIGFYLSEIENLLLLAQRAKETSGLK